MAMIAMTTNSSINVKPPRPFESMPEPGRFRSTSQVSKIRRMLTLEEPLQVLSAVGRIVDVQRRDRGLQKAPHRLAHVRGQPHEAKPPQVVGSNFAKVKCEQSPFTLLIEFIVRRQVAEVEKAVAHAAVFPIYDSHR